MEPLIGTESEVIVVEKELWMPESTLRPRRKRISDEAIAVVGKNRVLRRLGF